MTVPRRAMSALAAAASLLVVAPRSGAQATIVGTVFDSLRTIAFVKRATVVIPELPRYVITDEQGRFQIDSVPAGRYTITFLHPILDSLDITAEAFPITVPDKGTVTARLATPSPAALVWLICRAASDTFPSLMLGHVRSVDDSAGIAGATVTVAWSELVLGATSLEHRTSSAVAVTRASGSFVLCGIPSSTRLEVTATVDDRSTGKLAFSLNGEIVARRDFVIGQRSPAVAVSGTVRDAAGKPASNATVTVFGPVRTALTDEAGRFLIRDVPTGTQLFEARQIGAWPRTELVDVPRAGATELALSLGPRATGLPPVRSVGASPDDDTGFEERRHAGIGQFVAPEASEKKPAMSLGSLLLRAPLLFVGTTGRLKIIKMRSASGTDCVPNYFINGYVWRAGISGLAEREFQSVLEPGQIRGIEVYPYSAIPPFFDRRNGCGSVVMWTR